MLNSIDDIIALHQGSGNVEDAFKYIHIGNKVFVMNTYTLRFRKGNTTKEETRKWNLLILDEIKKDRNLQKEIREYTTLFEFFSKLKIKSGYLKKAESPDFIYEKNKRKSGIEITKIYVGNEWAAEKIAEEIKQYKLRKTEIEGYIEYKKYKNRITTFNVRGGIMIVPIANNVSSNEYVIEVKNKIFEKIRKLMDEYIKYDENFVFAEIVSPACFKNESDFETLNDEIKFYVEHLEENFDEREYKIILKTSDIYTEFDIKRGVYNRL